jgi:AcrR family transcriptional regulator
MATAPSIRARVRAEMTDDIKRVARRHLATDGANLSMRAVAREMGMVSSALYRYFSSRDHLLTALIIDAYDALGEATEAGDASVEDRTDLMARWLGCGHHVRRWALANPSEYALLFGSPVPGYAAPADTVAAALRTPAVLVAIVTDGVQSGALRPREQPALPATLLADLATVRAFFAPELPEGILALGTMAWVHLFGAVSFELFGQLNNVIAAREEYFDFQLRQLGALLGL